MKHLKKFENADYMENIPKYNKGDYVLFLTTSLDSTIRNCDIYNGYGKIFKPPLGNKLLWLYDVKYIRKETFTLDEMEEYIIEDDIIRKLTQEEIEEFEIKLNSNKYNL